MKDKLSKTMQVEEIDYNNILPPIEMKYYIENHLINDNEFIEDVDKYLYMSKIKDLPINERLEKLRNQYHNTARQLKKNQNLLLMRTVQKN